MEKAVKILGTMAIREVLKMGDPRLLAVAQPVLEFGTPELENLLSDHLDTRVSVVMSDADRRGRVVIEFADLEDLERIYRRMTDGATAPTSEQT